LEMVTWTSEAVRAIAVSRSQTRGRKGPPVSS
jgi:hypothetical protein